MKLGAPVFFENIEYPDQGVVDLYHELVSRHDHLYESLNLYGLLKYVTTNDSKDTSDVIMLREALLWFLTVEFHSRFISDSSTRNGSKRSLSKLVRKMQDSNLQDVYNDFLGKEAEIIGYIKIQRDNYFAHAANVSWERFPRVFVDEYERLLAAVADVLDVARGIIGTRRICCRVASKSDIFNPILFSKHDV